MCTSVKDTCGVFDRSHDVTTGRQLAPDHGAGNKPEPCLVYSHPDLVYPNSLVCSDCEAYGLKKHGLTRSDYILHAKYIYIYIYNIKT